MSLRRTHDENDDYNFSDFQQDNENSETLTHKRQVRKMLEERLERKRLKEEFDELDGEFDWDELER